MTIEVDKILDEADLLLNMGQYQSAIDKYNYIISKVDDCADAYLMRGAVHGEIGRIDDAKLDLLESIRLDPENDSTHITIALIYEKTKDYEDVIKHCEQSLKLNSKNKEAQTLLLKTCVYVGDGYHDKHKINDAERYYDRALAYNELNIDLLYKTMLVKNKLGKNEEAKGLASKILTLDNDHVNTKIFLVSIYEQCREYEKSEDILSQLIKEHPENSWVCINYANYLINSNRYVDAINLLTPFIENESCDKAAVYYMLGKLYDFTGDFDKAFEMYSMANQLSSVHYDPAVYVDYTSKMMEYFTAEQYKSLPASTNNTEEIIFIVGMMRSGTTLIEQILSSHSKVYGAGELKNVHDIAASAQKKYSFERPYPQFLAECDVEKMDEMANRLVGLTRQHDKKSEKIIDKLPYNFHHLMFIHKLLPKVKIIHCVRDARDTCLSCYFQGFSSHHPYANNLKTLGIHYKQYQRLMSHWTDVLKIPVHTINYEDLVSNTRNSVEKLLQYVGVGWEDECMEFYKNERFVKTASYNQVNKEIYTSSIDRWKNYEKYLGDIIEGLK